MRVSKDVIDGWGKTHPYPHFFEALRAFGNTSPEIARALGVSQRSAYCYMRGSALPNVKVVKRHPSIDLALTLDLTPQAAKTNNKVQEIAENMS